MSVSFFSFNFKVIELNIWVQNRIVIVVYPVVRRRERSIRMGIELEFFCLPNDQTPRQQWLAKMRRDVGPHFKLSGTTKVCSLHCYESDINKGGEVRHGNLEGHSPSFKAIFLPPIPLLMSLS